MNDIVQQLSLLRVFPTQAPPSRQFCKALMAKYLVPEHIQKHCEEVAHIAGILGKAFLAKGMQMCLGTVEAASLVHDIAKMYCIEHGGRHNEVGAQWIVQELENPLMAQAVLFHNYLPPEDIVLERHWCTVLLFYADSRVQHTECVSLKVRYDGFVERYGKTDAIRDHIALVREQAYTIEKMIAQYIQEDIDTLLQHNGVVVSME